MNNNAANPSEEKWKRRFYLLLGIISGQAIGSAIFHFGSPGVKTFMEGPVAVAWLLFIAFFCVLFLRKKLYFRAVSLAVCFIMFFLLFGFNWWCGSHSCSIIDGSPAWGARLENTPVTRR